MHPSLVSSRRGRAKPSRTVGLTLTIAAGWFLFMLTRLSTLQAVELVWRGRGQQTCSARIAEAGVNLAASTASSGAQARTRLYRKMEASLLTAGGLDFGSGATQGMSVGDLFRYEKGILLPVLHELDVPVRAIVMPLLDASAGRALTEATRRHLLPLLPAQGVWMQQPDLMHSTIYHASTHMAPVRASAAEVDAEAEAIAAAARRACPAHVVLERVVVTRSGTVLACWQVAQGAEPADLRRALAAALPHASSEQVVTDAAILHTTVARIVTAPEVRALAAGGRRGGSVAGAASEALRSAAAAMTAELCGLEVTMRELWFVEEQDKLALALDGRLTKRSIPLQCQHR